MAAFHEMQSKCKKMDTDHILLEHGLDVSALLLIFREDGPAPQKTSLLGRVPVELNCVLEPAVLDGFMAQQGSESLQDCHSPTAVIIRTRGREDRGQPEIDGILMRRNHDCRVGLTGYGGDDGALLPWVREGLCVNAFRTRLLDDIFDLPQKPFGRLFSVVGLVVAGVAVTFGVSTLKAEGNSKTGLKAGEGLV